MDVLVAAGASVPYLCGHPRDIIILLFHSPLSELQVGEEFILTIRIPAVIRGKMGLGVSYEAFIDDVQVTISLSCCSASVLLPLPSI